MELENLLENFKDKDVKAFNRLHEMYQVSIKGVVYNILRDREVTEEVVQDVFIKAWNNIDKYSEKKGRFFTWLVTIARNTAIDKLRSKDFKNKNKTVDSSSFVDIFESRDNLNIKIEAIGLRKHVANLGEKCHQLIELLYFKGYTQQETSDELSIPLGTVKTNIRRCISELRNMLKD